MQTTTVKYLQKYQPLLVGTGRKALIGKEEMLQRLLDGEELNLADMGVDEYILCSGRVSGKTQHDEIATISDIVNGMGDVWYTRSEDGDIRSSIFTSTLATIAQMGFSYSNKAGADFKVSYSPFEVTYNGNGNKIQFFAINKDINRTKGKVPPSGKLQRVIVEEANEPDSGIYIDALVSTAVRFFDTGSKVVYRYNPPMTRQHWCFDYFAKRERKGAKRIYGTWEDLAQQGLLTPATVAEILSTKRTDPQMYRYWYLGEVINLSGLVYPQLNRKEHVINIFNEIARGNFVTELCIGLDEGTVNDSTCCTPLAIMANGWAVVLDLYEYSPTDRTGQQGIAGQLAPTEQSRRIYDWAERLKQIFPFLANVQRSWIFESAEGGQQLRNQFVSDFGEETYLVQKKSIWGDVKRVRSMLTEGILHFHVAPNVNTETLLVDMENYVIDEKTNDIKKNQREDSIDSLEYATKLYFDKPIRR